MMPKWKSVEVHAHFFCEFWEHNTRLSLTNRLRWRMTKMMGAKKRRKGIKNMSVSPRDASSSDQHVATDADARCTKRAVLASGSVACKWIWNSFDFVWYFAHIHLQFSFSAFWYFLFSSLIRDKFDHSQIFRPVRTSDRIIPWSRTVRTWDGIELVPHYCSQHCSHHGCCRVVIVRMLLRNLPNWFMSERCIWFSGQVT